MRPGCVKRINLLLLCSAQAEQAAIPRVLTVFLGPLGVRHPAKVRLVSLGIPSHFQKHCNGQSPADRGQMRFFAMCCCDHFCWQWNKHAPFDSL